MRVRTGACARNCARRPAIAKEVRKVLAFMPNPSSLTEVVHCFLGEYERGGKKEEGEDIEVLEIDADEAFRMVEDGRIVDAKTVILLQRLRQELL